MTVADDGARTGPTGSAPTPKDVAPPVFHVTRAINNNVVLARESGADEERVLMGRGIGFKAEAGAPVDTGRVTQVFRPAGEPRLRRVLDALDEMVAGS